MGLYHKERLISRVVPTVDDDAADAAVYFSMQRADFMLPNMFFDIWKLAVEIEACVYILKLRA